MTDNPASIVSPCILVCAIEPESGHCYGCGRTRDEIARWTDYSANERTDLMQVLPARVEKLERRPRRITKRRRMAQSKTGNGTTRDILSLASNPIDET